jgi:pyruvate formate lyase activating enzyme
MVTNGYMEPEPLEKLLTVVDAMNIDIKSMDPGFYRRMCKGDLAPVLRTCERVKRRCHLEVTNLLIPDENDSAQQVAKLAAYVAANLGDDTPLHLSRYFPRHKLDLPPTPDSSLARAWDIAREKLHYVYLGNVAAGDKAHTACPSCGTLLVKRTGYFTKITSGLARDDNGGARCATCGSGIPILL